MADAMTTITYDAAAIERVREALKDATQWNSRVPRIIRHQLADCLALLAQPISQPVPEHIELLAVHFLFCMHAMQAEDDDEQREAAAHGAMAWIINHADKVLAEYPIDLYPSISQQDGGEG